MSNIEQKKMANQQYIYTVQREQYQSMKKNTAFPLSMIYVVHVYVQK